MTRTNRSARPRAHRLARAAVIAATAVLALALAGCSTGSEQTTPAPGESPAASSFMYPVTITDDASRTVTIDAEPTRVVSLAPANTEILFALGAGETLVGVTSYDDYPAEVAEIEKVGDFAGPNLEAVAAADPDVVFVTTGVQGDIIAKLEGLGAKVVALDPQTLEGVYEDIAEVSSIMNRVSEGTALVEDMRSRAAEVRAAVASEKPVTAFIEIGQNPLFTVGASTLLDELVTLAGGTNVVTEPGYIPYSAEQLVKADPDVYLATKSSGTDAETLGSRAGYAGLSAVKEGRVVILDDNLVSRPGPRIVEGLRIIAEGLHPNAFGK